MTDMPLLFSYFIAPDADNEPTLWLVDDEHPDDRPFALVRRCDIPRSGRSHVWSLIMQAHG